MSLIRIRKTSWGSFTDSYHWVYRHCWTALYTRRSLTPHARCEPSTTSGLAAGLRVFSQYILKHLFVRAQDRHQHGDFFVVLDNKDARGLRVVTRKVRDVRLSGLRPALFSQQLSVGFFGQPGPYLPWNQRSDNI